MDDLHIEDLTERSEGERDSEVGGKLFGDNLEETIMPISCLCCAHYDGLIAVFTSAKTDYLLSRQAVSPR